MVRVCGLYGVMEKEETIAIYIRMRPAVRKLVHTLRAAIGPYEGEGYGRRRRATRTRTKRIIIFVHMYILGHVVGEKRPS